MISKVAVFSSNWLGVSETFIFRQLKAIDDHGLESLVLTQKLIDSDLKKDYRGLVYYRKMDKFTFYLGIILRKLGVLKNGYFPSLGQMKEWNQGLRKNDVKLIHAHYGPSGLLILQSAKDLNIPLITTFHGNDASAMLSKKSYLKSLKALFDYSYIIVVSEFLRRRLISLGARENMIICHYIGTDLDKFEFHDRKSVHEKAKQNLKLQFLQVSNFVEKKGHKYTIEAFYRFLNVYPHAELILGGNGETKEGMIELVKKLGIEDKVVFLGAIGPDQVAKLMRDCDVFVHHSITAENGSEEGIPTVLMEAMASGIPVISSKHAGIPELIAKDCGFLVEEKNVIEYVAQLTSLINIDTKPIVENAKNRVYDYFDVKKQNTKLISHYLNIIGKKKQIIEVY